MTATLRSRTTEQRSVRGPSDEPVPAEQDEAADAVEGGEPDVKGSDSDTRRCCGDGPRGADPLRRSMSWPRPVRRLLMHMVLLVRHGQASFGEGNYDRLSELGRRQPETIGRAPAMRGLRQPATAHGTLRRQRETARLALASADLTGEPRVDPRWNEYDHLDLARRYATEHEPLAPRTSREFSDPARRRPHAVGRTRSRGGWPAFVSGVTGALHELCTRLEPGHDAVVFTSAGGIANACAGLPGGSAETVVALNRVAVNGAIRLRDAPGRWPSSLTAGSSSTRTKAIRDARAVAIWSLDPPSDAVGTKE